MKKKFTIEDIDETLMRKGLYWVVKLVYHPSTDSYKEAKLKDFDKPAMLLILKNGTNIHQHLKLEVDDDKFVFEIHGKKQDISDVWQEILGNTQQL